MFARASVRVSLSKSWTAKISAINWFAFFQNGLSICMRLGCVPEMGKSDTRSHAFFIVEKCPHFDFLSATEISLHHKPRAKTNVEMREVARFILLCRECREIVVVLSTVTHSAANDAPLDDRHPRPSRQGALWYVEFLCRTDELGRGQRETIYYPLE